MEFTREDWELFRTMDGLSIKAGVARDKIAALVAKELADNALDATGSCEVELLDDESVFYVQDHGEGIDPALIGDLFSFNRPHKSTKFGRLPTRGALGNALRVVAGAVYATDGKLRVYTSGQAMNLIPRADGSTEVHVIGEYDGNGTRVEVQLGSDAGPIDLRWAKNAIALSHGQDYKGKTSPWWYTSKDFHELCLAAKDAKVSDIVSQFEGCASKVGTITAVGSFRAQQATTITIDEARILLKRMQEVSAPVNPKRLGYCNFEGFELERSYVKEDGTFTITSDGEPVEIPYVIEVWTKLASRASIDVYVNRSPITGEVVAYHSKNELILYGCSLESSLNIGKRPTDTVLCIIVPYIPKTTDGKAPDLSYLKDEIERTVAKSIEKAKRSSPRGATHSQKSIVLANLDEAIQLTGGGKRFRQRQLFYKVRDIVGRGGGGELKYPHFTDIITDYERELGHDIPLMIRDDRGTVYHPHTGEQISLGTQMVEQYIPPDWTYNKVLYIEKEGFFPILMDEKWPEKHDCALLTSKGQATRAAKDFLDGLKDNKEGIKFFCIHDADAAGTIIYQALDQATKARPARDVEVENWGLEVKEGLDMGLEPETIEALKDERPVADYVSAEEAE